jgi:hypothetical protein
LITGGLQVHYLALAGVEPHAVVVAPGVDCFYYSLWEVGRRSRADDVRNDVVGVLGKRDSELLKALVDVGDEDKEKFKAKKAALNHSSLLLPFSVYLADANSLRAVTEVASDPTH